MAIMEDMLQRLQDGAGFDLPTFRLAYAEACAVTAATSRLRIALELIEVGDC